MMHPASKLSLGMVGLMIVASAAITRHPGATAPAPSGIRGTLAGAGDSVVLQLGRASDRYVAAAISNQATFYGQLGVKVENGAGVWELRLFRDGNIVTALSTFPNGTGAGEPGTTFTIPLQPGDVAVQVYVFAYDSGTTDVALSSSDRPNAAGFATIVPKDGFGTNWSPYWTLSGVGSLGTVTVPAPGAGKYLVVTGLVATLAANSTAPAATAEALVCNTNGGATNLLVAYMTLPATAGANAPPVVLTGVRLYGAENDSIVCAFQAAHTNVVEGLTLYGETIQK